MNRMRRPMSFKNVHWPSRLEEASIRRKAIDATKSKDNRCL
jgi:hypothetical protein